MTDAARKDPGLTTADIAGRSRAADQDAREPRPAGPTAVREQMTGAPAPAVERPRPADVPKPEAQEKTAPLFADAESRELRSRWDGIQTGFVDEPRKSVEEADALVAGTMKRLAEIFSQERSRLENQWSRGDNVSTEDLRLALQRYRSFFTRLLSV